MMVRHDKYLSDIDIQVNKCGCKYDPDMQMIKLKLCVPCVQSSVTPWAVACQAPPSMRFSTQEHWNGLPFHPSGGLIDPEVEPTSLASPVLAGGFFTTSAIWEGC